ncbi:hypothetical protein EVAR_99807_1 [Eumeta japonica]|uniref:Uncharacterized protein n=1 Tax=Eumeta variegata TaxID=151549 RepID=A0A4C1ZGM8_EUMVA|nr:hypothetical protein EVAR_99807_1 [Eumeta japonica]
MQQLLGKCNVTSSLGLTGADVCILTESAAPLQQVFVVKTKIDRGNKVARGERPKPGGVGRHAAARAGGLLRKWVTSGARQT